MGTIVHLTTAPPLTTTAGASHLTTTTGAPHKSLFTSLQFVFNPFYARSKTILAKK